MARFNLTSKVTPTQSGSQAVTLVEESTFAISDSRGDFHPEVAQGLFFRDTRVLSRWVLKVNGEPLDPLSFYVDEPFSAVFVARAYPRPGEADSTLIIFRNRYVGSGMREDLQIRNFGVEAAYVKLEFLVASDFSDLFAVKEGRIKKQEVDAFGYEAKAGNSDLVLSFKRGSTKRGIRIKPAFDAKISEDLIELEVVIAPKASWEGCIEFVPLINSTEISSRFRCGEKIEHTGPSEKLAKWKNKVPFVKSDHEYLTQVIERALDDLGALRIFDPGNKTRAVIAAGAPWFMTVFGRDSLLTSWMALIADPELALGVLETLARFQGKVVDESRDEQPGRILHEMRFLEANDLSLSSGSIYYGSIDATPLFVMLLGELRRWGLASETVDALLPNADRALEWIEKYGDLDGDGYVEYMRLSDRGLINQGWKDSFDSIRYIDGEIAKPPIALCEVQGYVYSAYLARAHFAIELGDNDTANKYINLAKDLKKRFNKDFWIEDKGWLAVGLDANKRQIDSLTSNMGHCLWTGILDIDKAETVKDKLMSDELFSGWGIRTLASNMGGYNPISYHCGSVWPHDNAIIASGLMRYGFVEESLRVISALLEVAASHDARPPELFGGISRSEFGQIVSYPTACSPQAWSSGSTLLALRTMLGLNPWVPYNKIWINPNLPPDIKYIRLERVPLCGCQVTIEVEGDSVSIEGLTKDVEIIKGPRSPQSSLLG